MTFLGATVVFVSFRTFRKASLHFATFRLARSLSRRALFAQDASHSPGWVVISVPEYRALRRKAYPADARTRTAARRTPPSPASNYDLA